MYKIVKTGSAFLMSALILAGCNCTSSEKEAEILAEVGEHRITADEFRLNYEFGFPHLKQGGTTAERKAHYLQWMVNEKLLAAEGYEQALDESEYVKKNERLLTRELLIESFLDKEVRSKIDITDQEIHEAVNKSKVKFKFRYWPVASFEQAHYLREQMNVHGFAPVVDQILQANPEVELKMEDFTTDYLTWLEVPDEVMDGLKNLEPGEVSVPVQTQGGIMLFQLLDFRREAVTENEYLSKAPTYKKILKARKYKKALVAFIDSFMSEKDVVTKRKSLGLLAKALEEWKDNADISAEPFPASVRSATAETADLYKLKRNQEQVLSVYDGQDLTIAAFIDGMSEAGFYEIVQAEGDLMATLNTRLALFIRNRCLSSAAREDGLETDPEVRRELNRWRDKWVYEEMISRLIEEEETGPDASGAGLSQADLDRILAELQNKYDVTVHTEVLDQIEISESDKSRGTAVMMFRGGTNRPAVPVADPRWMRVN